VDYQVLGVLMEQKDIVFLPYVRIDGIPTLRDSEILALWDRAEKEGWVDQLFHDGNISNRVQFLQYIISPGTLFFVCYFKGDICGFFWLNRLEITHAYCHFAFFKKYWNRKVNIPIGKTAMRMLFNSSKLNFELILGMLPGSNTRAIQYAKNVGFKFVGKIPNLLFSAKEGKPVEGVLVQLSKKDLQ